MVLISCSIASIPPGLNMLNQAKEFNEAVKLSGLILTKVCTEVVAGWQSH